MSFVLRDDQAHVLDEARALLRRKVPSLLIQAPTGFGKTVLSATMLGNVARRGKTAWFIVHRRELVDQARASFRFCGIPHATIASGFAADRRQPIQVCGIQTLVNRIQYYPAPDVIVYDECHHAAAGMWRKLREAVPNAVHIGLTATPIRLDGTGLRAWFSEMVLGPSVKQLIADGSLAPYRLLLPVHDGLDLSRARMVGGDLNKKDVDEAVTKSHIIGDSVTHYAQHAMGRRAAMFCHSIEASQEAVARFLAAGIPAEHVDGETDPDVRRNAIRRFERGETLVLSNVDLFGEGFDVPAIECVIDCAPTASLGRAMQRWGRGSRAAPGKTEWLLIDHVGNTGKMQEGVFVPKHGLPDDDREWSLDGLRKREKPATEAPIRQCPKCYATVRIGAVRCACGYEFTATPRTVETVDGELHEFQAGTRRATKAKPVTDVPEILTLDGLIAEGRRRGYKRPEAWAAELFTRREIAELNARRAGR